MYQGSYTGKILRVNLSGKTSSEEAVPEELVKNYLAAAGTSLTPEEIEKIGERINNIARLFNIGEGFTRQDDTFPKRLMTEAIKEGPSKGQLISQADLDTMLDEYYAERGWDKDGNPTPAKLKELGIKTH